MKKLVILLFFVPCIVFGDYDIYVGEQQTFLDSIPSNWIDSVRANIKVANWSASHGMQIICGLDTVMDQGGAAYNCTCAYMVLPNESGYLNVYYDEYASPGDFYKNGTDSTAQVLVNNPTINVVLFHHCPEFGLVDDSAHGTAYVDTFMDSMRVLRDSFPDVTFIYVAAHADQYGVTGCLRNHCNTVMRGECSDSSLVFYDFEAMDAYYWTGSVWDTSLHTGCPYHNDNWGWDNICGHVGVAHFTNKAYGMWHLLARIAGWDGQQEAETYKYKDFGSADDFNEAHDVWMEPCDSAHGDWRSVPWDDDNVADYPSRMAWYFTQDHTRTDTAFWWCTSVDTSNVIGSRAVMLRKCVYIHFDTAGFNETTDTLRFTIRYKDDVKGDSVSLYIYNEGGYYEMGKIAGEYDHSWKTSQFQINPDQRSVESGYGGMYLIRVAACFTNQVWGELPIDKIKLANNVHTPQFENDTTGYWPPSLPATQFPNLGKECVYRAGDDPVFLYGFYDRNADWILGLGGDTTTPSTDTMDSWQLLEDYHMNCFVMHGAWNQRNWYDAWVEWPDEYDWDDPGLCVEVGLDHQIVHAAAHGLKIIPNFLLATASWFVANEYGSEQRVLDTIAQIVADHQDSVILGFMPVDEREHDGVNDGKPQIYSTELYRRTRMADPASPSFVSLMGWQGDVGPDLAKPDAEAIAVICYIFGSTVQERLIRAAAFLDTVRGEINTDSTVLLGIPYAMDQQTPSWPLDGTNRTCHTYEIVAQAYLGVCHGVKGYFWWRLMHKHNDLHDAYGGYERVWAGIKQIGEELFVTEDGIADAIIDSTIEYMGESSIVTNERDSLHYAYFVTGGKHIITTVSGMRDATPTDTFYISQGLPAGTPVTVMFEDTSFAVNDSTIVWTYGNHYDRAVFTWDLGVPTKKLGKGQYGKGRY